VGWRVDTQTKFRNFYVMTSKQNIQRQLHLWRNRLATMPQADAKIGFKNNYE
jgi:hypothetical protein